MYYPLALLTPTAKLSDHMLLQTSESISRQVASYSQNLAQLHIALDWCPQMEEVSETIAGQTAASVTVNAFLWLTQVVKTRLTEDL